MEEPTRQILEPDTAKGLNVKKSHFKLIIYIVIVLIIAAGVGAYWWRDSIARSFEQQQATDITGYRARIADLEKELADVSVIDNTEDQTLCAEVAPDSTTIENIEASITSGNTAALGGYMASSVNVILAASEAYGPQTPAQAVADISGFISSDIMSWDYDFALPVATLATYQSGFYGQYFPDIAVVGLATNKRVISFSFDCNGKISTVFLATDEGLL
jgi:hypothetical protein